MITFCTYLTDFNSEDCLFFPCFIIMNIAIIKNPVLTYRGVRPSEVRGRDELWGGGGTDQYNENDWCNECPYEVCVISQPATVAQKHHIKSCQKDNAN